MHKIIYTILFLIIFSVQTFGVPFDENNYQSFVQCVIKHEYKLIEDHSFLSMNSQLIDNINVPDEKCNQLFLEMLDYLELSKEKMESVIAETNNLKTSQQFINKEQDIFFKEILDLEQNYNSCIYKALDISISDLNALIEKNTIYKKSILDEKCIYILQNEEEYLKNIDKKMKDFIKNDLSTNNQYKEYNPPIQTTKEQENIALQEIYNQNIQKIENLSKECTKLQEQLKTRTLLKNSDVDTKSIEASMQETEDERLRRWQERPWDWTLDRTKKMVDDTFKIAKETGIPFEELFHNNFTEALQTDPNASFKRARRLTHDVTNQKFSGATAGISSIIIAILFIAFLIYLLKEGTK